jgi:transcriptional regulator GlxA family with amidase domain
MVPGGPGTRSLSSDRDFIAWLAAWAASADLVTSVCTGSALLAVAGLLDGYRATSNMRALAWASGHGDAVEWVPSARWFHDRNRWTSSGIAAGMDMTAAQIAELLGEAEAVHAADDIELELLTELVGDNFGGLVRSF